MPKVISGNVPRFQRVRKALGKAARVRHFTISYAKEDRPSEEQMVRDAIALLRHFTARFPQPFSLDRLEWFLVLHHESAGDQIGPALEARKASHRFALHLFLLEHDLLTGKRLQPYYAPAHKSALGAWLKAYNKERGYACPSDPERSRKHAPRLSQKQLNDFAAGLAEATLSCVPDLARLTPEGWAKVIRSHCRDGIIHCSARDTRLVAQVRLPRMRSKTTLRTHPSKGLEIRAAMASTTVKHAVGQENCSRAFLTYLSPTLLPQVSKKRLTIIADDAADVLDPIRPGPDARISILKRKEPPPPTFN